jgi:hypothetical protein
MNKVTERRQHPRLTLKAAVRICTPSGSTSAELVELSLSGMRIFSPVRFEEMHLFSLEIDLPAPVRGVLPRINCDVCVIYSRKNFRNGYETGLYILRIDPIQKAHLQAMLDSHLGLSRPRFSPAIAK